MTTNNVWLITGAGRGMGVNIAKAALAQGYKVVATGRNTDKVTLAVGKSADLLVAKLDITKPADAESAVRAAVDRFGRIDVLVNNAANFYAGFFEELSPEQMERQLTTSLLGPMNVTRAVIPVMRKQLSGLIITISSTAGLVGFEFGTAYAASKFGLEGWMQSLQAEVEPFGINTMTVNPGFFRTELLTEESTNFAEWFICPTNLVASPRIHSRGTGSGNTREYSFGHRFPLGLRSGKRGNYQSYEIDERHRRCCPSDAAKRRDQPTSEEWAGRSENS